MENQKWTPSKVLYLVLAIMLTIQVIPMVGMVLNMFFMLSISGIVISIVILCRARKDNRSIVGAILALVTFGMAFVSGIMMWALADIPTDFADEHLGFMLWMILNWFVCIVATVFCYINTFAKRDGNNIPETTYTPNRPLQPVDSTVQMNNSTVEKITPIVNPTNTTGTQQSMAAQQATTTVTPTVETVERITPVVEPTPVVTPQPVQETATDTVVTEAAQVAEPEEKNEEITADSLDME